MGHRAIEGLQLRSSRGRCFPPASSVPPVAEASGKFPRTRPMGLDGLAHFTDRELQWRHKAWSKSFSHIADPVDQIDLVFTDGTATNPTRP